MLTSVWTMLRETVEDSIADNALSRGAAIAYHTVLSIGPVLVICIAIAGLVFGDEAAQGAIVSQLRGLMGDAGAEVLQAAIASASNRQSGIWATMIGVVTLLFTASGVFSEMQSALNAIWKAEPKGGVTALLKARATSLGLVGAMGFLLMVSLVVSTAVHALGKQFNAILPEVELLLQVANTLVSFGIIAALFAAVYKILPDRRLRWRDVGVGAVATAALFTLGKTLIGLYIGSSSVASSFGAASALVIVLIWIYYSAQIFLLGAEFTKVWAARHGSREAFAARNPGAPAGPSPVQEMVAHTAGVGRKLGLYDLAALAALFLMARRR